VRQNIDWNPRPGPQIKDAASYRYRLVLETPTQCLGYRFLVLLSDDTRSGRKHTEGGLTLGSIRRHAQLEERAEEFGPLVICGLKISTVVLGHICRDTLGKDQGGGG
jgi:hypothetical protein